VSLGVAAYLYVAKAFRITFEFHALRHTYARALNDAGAKVSDIQARLGHASIQTTRRYLAALRAGDSSHSEQLVAMFGTDSVFG
jgi:integrase